MSTHPKLMLCAKIAALVVLFAMVDVGLNFTLYNPAFVTPIYGYLLDHKWLAEEDTPGYPLVNIGRLNWSFYDGPRAAVIGTVQGVQKSSDGDWHINVTDGRNMLVAEIIPEYPVPVPKVGEKIRIWGVTRFDIAHRWWELHPVIGWQK